MEQTTQFTQEQALSVLVQAVKIAQKAGAFTLEDAEVVAKAVKVFAKPSDEVKSEVAASEPVTESKA